jgi:lipopolysaccharide biosynthesis regulator YciM
MAGEVAACAQAAGQTEAAASALAPLFDQRPGIDLLRALATLEGVPPARSPRLLALLRDQPSLSAALELLDLPRADWPDEARQAVRDAVARAARPQQRYRCAACGFEAQRHFWQCPGCLGWDTFPPQRIEEL